MTRMVAMALLLSMAQPMLAADLPQSIHHPHRIRYAEERRPLETCPVAIFGLIAMSDCNSGVDAFALATGR